MKHGVIGAGVLLLAAALAIPVAAQTVYRCGPNANVYSQQPCADGKALDVNDPRTATQQREARASANKDAKWAEAMQREREKAGRAATPAAAGSSRIEAPAVAAKPPKPAASKPTLYIEPIKPMPSKP